jgi:hypothetical protein
MTSTSYRDHTVCHHYVELWQPRTKAVLLIHGLHKDRAADLDPTAYPLFVIGFETMNAMPRRPASLVVAASDGPGG